MGAIRDKIINTIINRLANEGNKLIIQAFSQADFNKNKTQNLHDSYGSAVYYNGKLVQGTQRFMTNLAKVGRYNSYTQQVEYGREEIESFFRDYKANNKGFELVIAVAMFYGTCLEEGSGNLKRKYRVISSVADEVQALASKYKGTVRRIKEGVKQ